MKFYFIIICILAISCSKSKDPIANFANNHINIKIYRSNGDSTLYSFHGEYAPMFIGRSFNGFPDAFQAECKVIASERLIVFGQDSHDPMLSNVYCVYFDPAAQPNSYSTSSVINPGTITFTSFGNNHAKGSFQAKCKTLTDSVI